MVEVDPLSCTQSRERQQSANVCMLRFNSRRERCRQKTQAFGVDLHGLASQVNFVEHDWDPVHTTRFAAEEVTDRFLIKPNFEACPTIFEQRPQVHFQCLALRGQGAPALLLPADCSSFDAEIGVESEPSLYPIRSKVQQFAVIDIEQHGVVQGLCIVFRSKSLTVFSS